MTLVDAYREEEIDGEVRVLMKLSPKLAPMKAAVLPLVKRDGMPELGHRIVEDLQRSYRVFYDESASVGTRYRRQDEIGTPYCFTIDAQSLEDQSVTVRDRDTMQQERVAMSQLRGWLDERVT